MESDTGTDAGTGTDKRTAVSNRRPLSASDLALVPVRLLGFLPSFTPQQAADAVWLMGTAGVDARQEAGRRAVVAALCGGFTDQGLANALWGLQRMDCSWEDMPLPVQQVLVGALSRLCFTMHPQATANTLYSLGKMGLTASQLGDKMLISVELAVRKSAPRMVGADVVQTLQGLGLMQYAWGDLSEGTREALAGAAFEKALRWYDVGPACAKEVGTLAYSLAQLGCQVATMSSPLRACLWAGMVAMGDFEQLDG
ncbi:hypothetical protein B484DRAFT_407332, partial [Ochromonadaceae sp. CCMP2298]